MLSCSRATLIGAVGFLVTGLSATWAQPPSTAQAATDVMQACTDSAPEAFVAWAKQHALTLKSLDPNAPMRELSPLRSVVGEARVVGLGESARRVHEFYELRSRLFRFLVEEMGFTALVMETGFAEASILNEYVLGRIEEPAQWQEGFTFGFGDEKEIQALLRWIRTYNQDSRHARKVHFYGMDSMVVYSNPATALRKAFSYLDHVDNNFRSSPIESDLLSLAAQMDGSGKSMRDLHVSLAKYVKLSVEQRNAYTARVVDLLTLLESNRLAYLERSTEDEYEWAHHFAVAAKQLDTQYRLAATTVKPGGELNPSDVPAAIFAARDRAMFDNVLWALQREGNQGRVALWAHNAHIAKKSVPGGGSTLAGVFAAGPRVGMFLDALFGPKYVNIGTTFYDGRSGWQPQHGPSTCGMIDRELNRVGPPLFVLNMAAAGRARVADEWFASPRLIRADDPGSAWRIRLPAAWDALVFIRRISPVQVQ